jgi:hypothetical protein
MSVLTIFILLLILAITLWAESGKLTPLALTSLNLTPVLVGYAQFDAKDGSNTALLYCGAFGCLVAGYLLFRLWKPMRVRPIHISNRNGLASTRTSGLRVFVYLIIGLAAYHFAFSGIPVLSEDVERVRFDFTSSGFYGIPGRMFLFGLPFAVLLVTVAAGRKLTRVSRRLLYFVWSAYAIASLLAGFKGGLINVLMTMLLARTLIGAPISCFRLATGWRSVVVLGALAYCVAISLRYKSLGLSGPGDVMPYLAARMTTIAAAPGRLVFLRFGSEGTGGQQFAGDITYFLSKYMPFVSLEGASSLPLDKTISAALYHTPISDDAFIVPVTIGAFPELVANYGAPVASAAMFLVGVLLCYLVRQAQTCVSALKSAVAAFTVYMLQIYVPNGNLIYTLFNLCLMILLLVFIYCLCNISALRLRDQEAANLMTRRLSAS